MKHPTKAEKGKCFFFAQTFLLAKKLCFEHIDVVPDFYLWVALDAHSSLGAWRMFLEAAALASAVGQSAPVPTRGGTSLSCFRLSHWFFLERIPILVGM